MHGSASIGYKRPASLFPEKRCLRCRISKWTCKSACWCGLYQCRSASGFPWLFEESELGILSASKLNYRFYIHAGISARCKYLKTQGFRAGFLIFSPCKYRWTAGTGFRWKKYGWKWCRELPLAAASKPWSRLVSYSGLRILPIWELRQHQFLWPRRSLCPPFLAAFRKPQRFTSKSSSLKFYGTLGKLCSGIYSQTESASCQISDGICSEDLKVRLFSNSCFTMLTTFEDLIESKIII